MSDNIVGANKPTWDAAEIILEYHDAGEHQSKEIKVSRQQMEDERKQELIQQGMDKDKVADLELPVEQFQAMVFMSAKSLAKEPWRRVLSLSQCHHSCYGQPQGDE